MRTFKILTLTLFFPVFLTSCLPQISVRAGSGDEATVFFSTGFSESMSKTLKAMTGMENSAPLFNKTDVLALLNSAGAVNASAAIPNPTEISATGTIPELSKNQLSQAGLLLKTKNSLTFTLGPEQISVFYGLLNEESKSYLDLMMIPALIGEKMSAAEYRELLSSLYGPTFADEIINSRLAISLSSPDGKHTKKETVTLGELLTAEKELSWRLEF